VPGFLLYFASALFRVMQLKKMWRSNEVMGRIVCRAATVHTYAVLFVVRDFHEYITFAPIFLVPVHTVEAFCNGSITSCVAICFGSARGRHGSVLRDDPGVPL